MPKLFFFIGLILLIATFLIWFIRQWFTPEELGEITDKHNSQSTLREKQLHINEEFSTLSKAKATKVKKISDDIEDKQSNKL